MAKDFSNTGKYSSITLTYILRVTETAVDTVNNRSKVKVQAILKQDWTGDLFWQYGTGVSCTINGTQIFSNYTQRNLSGASEHVYYTWEDYISHGNDGKLSLKVGGKCWQNKPDYFPSAGITITESSSNTLALTDIPRNFTLSFNANGGSVGTASKTVTYGSTYGTLPTPTRTGHTFNGWYTATSGGTRKQSGDTYNTLGNSTLYAQWSVNNYSYNFNVLLPDGSEPWQTGAAGSVECSINGGSWTRIYNEATSSYAYGTTFKFRNFTPGTGLNLSSVSGVTTNSDGTWSATMGTSGLNINFKTAWNKYYFDLNGLLDGTFSGGINGYGTADVYINGSLASPDCYDYYTQHNYGSTYEVKDIRATTGHTYHGVSSGSLSGTITGNTGVTLKFTTNTYTISYNANGGSGAPGSQTKTHGVSLTLSSTVPSRTGYTFLGWGTSANATTASYSAGGTYVAEGAATLYAIWTQSTFIQTIMARYQKTDGSFTDYSSVYAGSLKQGDSCSWSSDETIEYESANISYTVGTSAETKYVTVYRKKYSLSYDSNGGLGGPSGQSYYYGSSPKLTLNRPTRSGYDFLGWSQSPNGNIDWVSGGGFSGIETTHPTLYAIWERRKTKIHLYSTGTCEASEFIEGEGSLIFDNYGAVYSDEFIEGNDIFEIGNDFTCFEISEIYIEKVYPQDEDGRYLVDEKGNILYFEEEV